MTVFTCDALARLTIASDGGQFFAGPCSFADLTNLAPRQGAATRDAIAVSVADQMFQRA